MNGVKVTKKKNKKTIDDAVSTIIKETVDVLKSHEKIFNDLEIQEQGDFVTNMSILIKHEIEACLSDC